MTEKYIRGISNNSATLRSSISERSWNYHHDSEKSPFTPLERANKKYYIPNITTNKFPNDYYHTSTTSVLRKNSVEKSFVPSRSTINEGVKVSPLSNVTSTLISRRGESYSTANNITSHNVSPPKAVKFEDTLENIDDMRTLENIDDIRNKHFKESYYESLVKSGKDTYGVDGAYHDTRKEEEFDTIDEKVKEGKEILQRLLKSTETKKPTETKRLLNTDKSDREHGNQTFTPIKSPLDSAWNETEETISKCDGNFSMDMQTESNTHLNDMKELKDPIFMSTRLDNDERTAINSFCERSAMHSISERSAMHSTSERPAMNSMSERPAMNSMSERPAMNSVSERSAMNSVNERSAMNSVNERSAMKKMNKGDDSQDEKLLEEIKVLKEELSNHEVNSFFEMKSVKEDNEKVVVKLYGQLTILNKQKDTLEDYINQLKSSVTKKNDKCFELQEQLHKKLTLIHQLTTSDDQERHNLENELNILQGRKKTLEEQIGKMEKSLKNQYDEIKELEKRFQREKQSNMDMLRKKDEVITSLHLKIELLTEENHSKELEMKSETQTQVEKAVLRGKNLMQSQVEEVKLSLDNEVERQTRLQSKHQVEVNHLKTNFESFKAANVKLKQEVEAGRLQNQNLEKSNLMNIKNVKDEAEFDCDLLKKKIIEYERIQKSMALELIEESTKLAVVCGTSPSSSRVSSPDAYIDCNIMSEAMIVFKEHLENFRHYALSLRHEKQNQKFESNDESTVSSSGNVQTSAKLLRHLQNRVQQLRKENAMLRENSICESCQNENKLNMSDMGNCVVENNWVQKEIIPIEDHLPVSSMKSSHVIIHKTLLTSTTYCNTSITKDDLPENMMKWEVSYPEYNPVYFTADKIKNETSREHADISSELPTIKFNDIDRQIDRRSHMGIYEVMEGIPRNPIGRTGITGRGLLRRWGPNHVIDPIVTRWLLNKNGDMIKKDGKPVLEFVAIQMKETGEWAIPGGMLDFGQNISPLLRKEFVENASNAFEENDPVFSGIKSRMDKLFECGVVIYKGYVDDPRNTDNAWIETIAINYHDDNNDSVALIPLKNDGDVNNLHWVEIDSEVNLVGNHISFIKHVCYQRRSYYEA